jgi:hypothetical protein
VVAWRRDRANADLLFGFGGGRRRARCIISNKTRGDVTLPTQCEVEREEEVKEKTGAGGGKGRGAAVAFVYAF